VLIKSENGIENNMRKKKKNSIIDLEPYRSKNKIKKKIIQKNIMLSRNDSDILKEIEMIKKIVKETPDIREEKVARLREEIKKGAYVVNSRKIAENMIRECLLQQQCRPKNRDC
jgi:flagellar biosynthesis anti-sigma factor FlgM